MDAIWIVALVVGGALLVHFVVFHFIWSKAKGGGDRVSEASKAWEAIKAGALVVDVRGANECASGMLDGAINIPHTEVEARLAEFGDDKARAIVVYCASGKRSGMARDVLVGAGFTNVINGGGYNDMLGAKP